jgi:hypothetical protein
MNYGLLREYDGAHDSADVKSPLFQGPNEQRADRLAGWKISPAVIPGESGKDVMWSSRDGLAASKPACAGRTNAKNLDELVHPVKQP